jgi:CheY-like chemotaxis protein
MEVLIIDDDCEDRELLNDAIREVAPNVNIHTAGTAHEAIEKVQTLQRLRLIFLDGKLPGMSGLELLNQLRQNHIMAEVKVIVYSGFTSPDVQKDFLRGGANVVMEKVSSYQFLVAKLTQLFSNLHE